MMNNEARNFAAIPAAACRMAGGEIELGDNGEKAKTAPIRLKARSGQPIEHWFWGRVVHDLAGMRLNKPRLTVDYAHNESEVLGYLNHFDTESGDLITSGALTPFRDDDRASEVLFKMREGVPYEASIFFGGDGIKIEEVADGMVAQVNGYQFDGPGLVIREWPLRGVAICPYGADANTESAVMTGGETYAAATVAHEESNMSASETAVEVEASTEEKSVDVVTVDAEAQPAEQEPVVDEAAAVTEEAVTIEDAPASEVDLAEADALRARLSAVEADKAQLTIRTTELEADKTAMASDNARLVGELRATTEALKTVTAERDGLRVKLAAVEKGAPPVSAAPAGEDGALTPWQKAQRKTKA